MPPCIRHAQCVSHAHNEQGVAVGEKILAYRNLWSLRDRRRSRYSLVAEPRQISLSDDLSRPQFPYFEDQFWSFLRILRIILRKTSFLVNPPVHENVVDMLYFSANIWSKKRIQFFPLLFFYYFDQPGRLHKRKNSRENFPNGRRMKFLRYA